MHNVSEYQKMILKQRGKSQKTNNIDSIYKILENTTFKAYIVNGLIYKC